MDIKSALPVCYTVEMTPGILGPENSKLLEFGSSSRRFVVVDQNVHSAYMDKILNYFKSLQIHAHIVIIDSIEDKKNLETILELTKEMDDFGLLRRREPVIAIGGGVLLDLVGFACSIYRRGVPYIRVPTTLVGLVDASIGIKTGINYNTRRNRLGSYYPPLASYLDIEFLQTLMPIEISSGLGEIIKMAVIKDARLFELLESHTAALYRTRFRGPSVASAEVIQRAINGMKEELENNLWETILERSVDFGHSFSPIIEMRSLSSNHPLTHGQAVTLDVIFSSILAMNRKHISRNDLFRIIRIASAAQLPIKHPLFWEPLLLLESLNDTIKHRDGCQNLPIPIKIGDCIFLQDVSFAEIQQAVETWKNL